ncbi:MAG: DUF2207 domain-containing protein [Oscillospiraceae bacterium]|jgi:hypothetical protein|nr:DUF2207 domain-containing protein [Oscillospiraceae bacterium]
MERQYFNTKAEKNVKRTNTIVFFSISMVVLAIILYVVIGIPVSNKNVMNLQGSSIMLLLFTIIAVEMFLFFFIPIIGVFFGIQSGRKKGYRERATFTATQGITYYRDILCDVNPADLSIVMDLKIDSCKDISATLLRLYNKNAIDFESGQIVYKGKNAALDNSESELVAMISSGGITQSGINTWKENRREEAKNKGYVEQADKPKGCAGCGVGCLGIIIVIVCFIVLFFITNDNSFEIYEEVLDKIGDKNAVIIASDIQIINRFLTSAVIAFALLDIIMIFPAFSIFRFFAYSAVKSTNTLKRTNKGDELAEKAAGLKRFINEFSTLSERKKEEVMLWDDFLVYAVVLEENDMMVNDIVKFYNSSTTCKKKINLRSFTGNFRQ